MLLLGAAVRSKVTPPPSNPPALLLMLAPMSPPETPIDSEPVRCSDRDGEVDEEDSGRAGEEAAAEPQVDEEGAEASLRLLPACGRCCRGGEACISRLSSSFSRANWSSVFPSCCGGCFSGDVGPVAAAVERKEKAEEAPVAAAAGSAAASSSSSLAAVLARPGEAPGEDVEGASTAAADRKLNADDGAVVLVCSIVVAAAPAPSLLATTFSFPSTAAAFSPPRRANADDGDAPLSGERHPAPVLDDVPPLTFPPPTAKKLKAEEATPPISFAAESSPFEIFAGDGGADRSNVAARKLNAEEAAAAAAEAAGASTAPSASSSSSSSSPPPA
jgi:hypothetical protein